VSILKLRNTRRLSIILLPILIFVLLSSGFINEARAAESDIIISGGERRPGFDPVTYVFDQDAFVDEAYDLSTPPISASDYRWLGGATNANEAFSGYSPDTGFHTLFDGEVISMVFTDLVPINYTGVDIVYFNCIAKVMFPFGYDSLKEPSPIGSPLILIYLLTLVMTMNGGSCGGRHYTMVVQELRSRLTKLT